MLPAQAGVNQRSWVTQPRIIGSEVGATYNAGRYSLGVSVAPRSGSEHDSAAARAARRGDRRQRIAGFR